MSSEIDSVRVLVPQVGTEAFVAGVAPPLPMADVPFAPERVVLLENLSTAILHHPRLRRDPGGAALGFWLRRAHLAELRAQFGPTAEKNVRVPAGLVLHVAPANVDTMFVFSWALSFLAGNANIMRITTRISPVIEDLLECVNQCFLEAPAAAAGNWFVTYEHDDAITSHFSLLCDTRIVWGGDETVRKIRALPLSPHAAERAFASKRSVSVFDAVGYLAADVPARGEIARKMAADIVPFSQMACSSPHVVYWIGPGSVEKVIEDFAARLEAAMRARSAEPDMVAASHRINHAFENAAAGRSQRVLHFANSTSLVANSPTTAEPPELCGAGLLVQTSCASVEALASMLRRNHQTITYYGLSADDRKRLAVMAGRAGVDRVVPIGRALDFGPQWDGYDLWGDLTRVVVVE